MPRCSSPAIDVHASGSLVSGAAGRYLSGMATTLKLFTDFV
jgi:hypothetical protein